MESEEKIHSIAVVGLGLIGASFCAACKQAAQSCRIFGVDVNRDSREAALAKGWVNAAGAPDDPGFESFVEQGCDLVVLATPAESARLYLEWLENWGYAGIITDTASTKSRICEEAASILSKPQLFIPGHPMAGSEVNGIEGARANLFEGCHWILCPNEETSAEAFTRLHELLVDIKARIVSLPREEHDRAVAIVSHVPHFVASALVQLACRHADAQQSLFRLAAGGFKDCTRVAAGSPELWCGIAFDNKQALSEGLAEMRSIIGAFQQALDANDRKQLFKLLEDNAQARRSLPARWVPATENLVEVRIPMENRKGVVAEATTIASKVGCNIQSIEIDHLTADRAVLSMILTDEGDIGKLSMQLIGAGFTVNLAPLSAKEYSHVH